MPEINEEKGLKRRLKEAVSNYGTPVFVFRWEPVAKRLSELCDALNDLPVRFWYSFKTCPLPILMDRWKRTGQAVEVVSEFELQGALRTGFLPEQILVNGVAKHRWLPRHRIKGLRVNFDSISEIRAVGELARELDWSTGRTVPSGRPARSG